MTAVVTVTAPSDEDTADLVEDLAEELESFAFERERVLAKLDIRAATTARRLSRELRLVLRGLAVAAGDESREGVFATLGSLLEEAHRVLEGVAVDGAAASPAADVSPAGDSDGDRAEPSSGLRPIDGEDHGDRSTIESLPSVNHDPDDPEESPDDLTIARRVMWERSGNRILGR